MTDGLDVLFVLALVVALALFARERRRTRLLRRDGVYLRGRYLNAIVAANGRLHSAQEDAEALRVRLLLSTLRAGDATCAPGDGEALPAAIVRREFPS